MALHSPCLCLCPSDLVVCSWGTSLVTHRQLVTTRDGLFVIHLEKEPPVSYGHGACGWGGGGRMGACVCLILIYGGGPHFRSCFTLHPSPPLAPLPLSLSGSSPAEPTLLVHTVLGASCCLGFAAYPLAVSLQCVADCLFSVLFNVLHLYN